MNMFRSKIPHAPVGMRTYFGLEYNSVKVVITDEVEELVTHDVFYTAITRAKEKLKIYWTPEVEQKVLTRIKPKDISKDVEILKEYLK